MCILTQNNVVCILVLPAEMEKGVGIRWNGRVGGEYAGM